MTGEKQTAFMLAWGHPPQQRGNTWPKKEFPCDSPGLATVCNSETIHNFYHLPGRSSERLRSTCLNGSGANGNKIAWGVNQYSISCIFGNAGLDLCSLCVCMCINNNLYFTLILTHGHNRLFSQQLNFIFLSSIERKMPRNHLGTPASSCAIQKLLVLLWSHQQKENDTLGDVKRVTTFCHEESIYPFLVQRH